jgi:hypothetical protein
MNRKEIKENAKGALKNVFNTLIFKKGVIAAFWSADAAACAGLTVAFAVTSVANPALIPIALLCAISTEMAVGHSVKAAQKHDKAKALQNPSL